MVGTTFLTEPPTRLCIASARSEAASTRAPVLLIHGAWHAGWAWENWMRHLARRGYDSYAVDLRGHGGSEGSWRTAGLCDYLDDARRAIAALPEPPVLIGHSLGGLLVLHLLTEAIYPAAALVASVPGRYPAWLVARETVRREMLLTAPAAPLPGTPTLVMTGSRDPLFGGRMQAELAERIEADLVEIEDCGHDVPLDGPWPEAADAAVDWFENALPTATPIHHEASR